jgi:hypothetical protein
MADIFLLIAIQIAGISGLSTANLPITLFHFHWSARNKHKLPIPLHSSAIGRSYLSIKLGRIGPFIRVRKCLEGVAVKYIHGKPLFLFLNYAGQIYMYLFPRERLLRLL